MKIKNLNLIIMIVLAIVLIYNQSTAKPNILIQIVCIMLFFIGMSRLSAKTPSKNVDGE
jgi:hypothetical protein